MLGVIGSQVWEDLFQLGPKSQSSQACTDQWGEYCGRNRKCKPWLGTIWVWLRDRKRPDVAGVQWAKGEWQGPVERATYSMVKSSDTISIVMGSHWTIVIRRKLYSGFSLFNLLRAVLLTCKKQDDHGSYLRGCQSIKWDIANKVLGAGTYHHVIKGGYCYFCVIDVFISAALDGIMFLQKSYVTGFRVNDSMR